LGMVQKRHCETDTAKHYVTLNYALGFFILLGLLPALLIISMQLRRASFLSRNLASRVKLYSL